MIPHGSMEMQCKVQWEERISTFINVKSSTNVRRGIKIIAFARK
jgi:hypothetical protein